METTSKFQQMLQKGQFVIVAECVPPSRPDAEAVKAAAAALRGKVDAVGVADNRLEIMMSAVATAALLRAEGVEPIVHITTRDRNRIALMSDVLGAHALGLRNFLCTSGDHQTLGRERAARNVFDLDSVQWLSVLDRLRREGVLFEQGRSVGPCEMCLGATANPLADPREMQLIRVGKKVKAGADFIVTQPMFDAEVVEQWLGSLQEWGVTGKTAILIGILVAPSAAKAREMREKVPGIVIPDAVIQRLESVGPDRQEAEAIAIAVEVIGRMRGLNGIRGFYLMTEGDHAAAVDVIERVKR
jgi:methylenetetrahydrofolate reductase (NADPH)